MKLWVLAVGKLKDAHGRDAAAEYVRRIRRHLPCEVVEVKDASAEADEGKAIALEGGRLRQATARQDAYRVALDREGRAYSSLEFARLVDERMTYGGRDLAFFIGGPRGLDLALRKESDVELSLSPMTLPHDLARIVLLEQLYRSLSIIKGEPYHR